MNRRNPRGKRRKRRRRDSDDEEDYEPVDDYSILREEKYLRDEHLRQPIVKQSERPLTTKCYEGMRWARHISKLAQTSPFYQVRESKIPHPLLSTQVSSKGKRVVERELRKRLRLDSLYVPNIVKGLSGIVNKQQLGRNFELGPEIVMSSSDVLLGIASAENDIGRDRGHTEGTEGNEENLLAAIEDDNEDFEAGDYGDTYNNDSEEEPGDDSTNILSM